MTRNLPYDRADRVGKQIYQIVSSHIYKNIDDAKLKGLQLTHATLTKDFSLVRIFYYASGGDAKRKEVLEALNSFRFELRQMLAKELSIRTIPKIEFLLDKGVENAERVDEILKGISHDEGNL